MTDIARAARLLWSPIPPPARKPAKPRKTFKTLERGRELKLLTRWYDGKIYHEIGEIFIVTEPITDQGVILCDTEGDLRNWSREWKGTFEKVRKRPKRKKQGDVK